MSRAFRRPALVFAFLLFVGPTEFSRSQDITVQLPTFGVAIDAEGVLSVKSFPDPGGRLHAMRMAASQRSLPPDVAVHSPLRKVSLVRLERTVQQLLDAGGQPDASMRYLAGLQRLQFVFLYPHSHDIVIAGPAEGWVEDLSGRAVGTISGRPTLELQDLIVALRTYAPGTQNRPFVGCTIDPDPRSLVRFQQFQQTIPGSIPQHARRRTAAYIASGSRESLGMANIRVFGISPKTHFAHVLLEADYRMKLIGIGLESPPVRMVTFLSSLADARQGMLQRWWFTPDYDCVRVGADGLAMELVGDGVQLLAEDKLIGPDGSLAAAGARPNRASELFTTSFTAKYSDIADRSPVYAQLRNLIDMLVAAAYIRGQDHYGRAGWTMSTFRDESVVPVETGPPPGKVACVVNTVWKGNRLLSPAGGGVSIRADQALDPQRRLQDEDGRLRETHIEAASSPDADRWWWD